MSKILEKEILLNSLIKNTNKLLLEDNEIKKKIILIVKFIPLYQMI